MSLGWPFQNDYKLKLINSWKRKRLLKETTQMSKMEMKVEMQVILKNMVLSLQWSPLIRGEFV